jgi:transcriptional regulator with XRE-family HTH domain
VHIDKVQKGFGARLVQERKRLGISQAALARAADVAKPTQLAYEQGERLPGLDYLMRATAVGMDFWFLVWEVPHRTKALEFIDWERLAVIHERIDEWARDNDLTVTARKRVDLARVVYAVCLEKSTFDPEDVDMVMKLVA